MLIRLVWTLLDITSGLAVVSDCLMLCVGCFMLATYSCASALLYMLGVTCVLLSSNGLLADFPLWGRNDFLGVLSEVCPSCSFISVVTLLPPDTVSDAPTGAGSRG